MKNNLRIVIAGQWFTQIYEEPLANALSNLGNTIIPFKFHTYFKGYPYPLYFKPEQNIIKSFYYRFQNKYGIGPTVNKLNKDFESLCTKHSPDIIFLFRNTLLNNNTIKKLRSSNTKIFCYNNDDPFGKSISPYLWRHFFSTLSDCDHIFCFRKKNLIDYKKIGFNNTSLLRSWYIKDLNFKIKNKSSTTYKHDVVFIGHFENDGRDEYILDLCNSNINIGLYGTGWSLSNRHKELKKYFGEIKPLYGIEYNIALNNSKIALSFLSKTNNDTYTRRSFEIPATGTFMLSERTSDLQSLFKEGIEAEYFSTKAEFLSKVKRYLNDENAIRAIGESGLKRLLHDGHEIKDRALQIINTFYNCKN